MRNGRSTVSQRTDDLESGSSTATLPAFSPPPPPLRRCRRSRRRRRTCDGQRERAAAPRDRHARAWAPPPHRVGHGLPPHGLGCWTSSRAAPRPRTRAAIALGLGEDERDARRAPRRGRRASRRRRAAACTAVGSAERSSDSRTPSSSSSPASARSPPTISSSGLSTLTSVAAALPIARPASAITRRQPRSPSRARRDDRAAVEAVAVAAPQQLGQRVGAGDGLQAAAVAAAADGAVGVDEHVAELAGQALGAAVEAAVEHQPGADARGDHQVDQVLARRARRRTRPRPARRGSRRCRRGSAARGGGASPSAAATPTQPGRIAVEPTTPVGAVDRARQAHARRRSPAPGRRPASVEHLADELGGGVEALVGEVVGVEALLALGEDPRREVRDRHADVVVVEVDADRDARRRRRRRAGSAGARPGRRGRRRARGARRRARRPAARRRGWRRSSATSPVRRAISAREISPSSRSAWITRRRLSRRRVSSDPVRACGHGGYPIRSARRLSILGRTSAVRSAGFVHNGNLIIRQGPGTRRPGRRRRWPPCRASTASPCPTASRSSRGQRDRRDDRSRASGPAPGRSRSGRRR